MGYFITGATLNKQNLTEDGMYVALNNQLYMDDDGTIYLCPRGQVYDGYTIPRILAPIAGGHFTWDLRCCREHDLNCLTHQEIVVNLSLTQIKSKGYLYTYENETYCYDIPKEFLTVRNVSFNKTNSKFKRMMKSTSLPSWRVNMMRLAVNFNIGWLFSGKNKDKINLDKIYS